MNQQRLLIAGLIVAGVCVAASVTLNNLASSESNAVDMRGYQTVSIVLTDAGFRPERVIVDVGTELVFTTDRDAPFWPASNQHPAHTLYSAFDPLEPIAPGDSWSFVIEKKGVWGIHDHIRSYYMGIVYVR